MIMIVVLHEVLLMVILSMLLPLISGLYRWFPYLTGLHKGQNASKNYVTKNSELFQDIPNLAELPLIRHTLQSKVSMSTTTSRLFQYSKMWSHAHAEDIASDKDYFEDFQKEKGRFFMPTFCHIFHALVMIYFTLPCFSWHNMLQRQEFWVLQLIPHVLGQKVKFTIHLSLFTVTIHLSLFTCYCSLRIFAYLRGLSLIFQVSF